MLPRVGKTRPLMPQNRTAELLRLLLEKAEGLGLSATRLLRRCNLSFSLSDLQQGHIEAIPQAVFVRASELCLCEMRVRSAPSGMNSMSRNDFDLMCHALISSTSLREVIERTVQFLEVCDRRYGWLSTEEKKGEFAINFFLGPAEAWWETYFLMYAFQTFTRLHEWIIGQRIALQFEMKCDATDEALRIARLFGMKMHFGSVSNRIVFPASYLDKPVVRDAQELRQLLRSYPFDPVAPSTDATFSTRVTSLFQDAVANGRDLPSLAQLAHRMGMASATFRRHLAAEGETIRSIKERVRTNVALKMLASQDVHPDQVAEMLGFSSAKAFSRAFVSWSGLTPAAYRRQALGNRPGRNPPS